MTALLADEWDTLLREYDGRFPDETPPGWGVLIAHGKFTATFPNRVTHECRLDSYESFWNVSPVKDPTTSTLWRNSLRYLLEIDDNAEGWSVIVNVLQAFIQYIDRLVPSYDELRSGSLDHQMSLGLRVVGRLRSRLVVSVLPDWSRREVDDVLCNVVARLALIIQEAVQFLDNNHGVMLAIACEQASLVFRDVAGIADIRARSDRFLSSCLDIVFDEQGIARENTPLYQKMYVELLRQVVSFRTWSRDSADASSQLITRMADRAEQALALMLLPNGHVPAIGDSSGGGCSYLPQSGTLFSADSGCYFTKTDETYVSAVCGFRGVIHKQADDMSMTLWHRGMSLIRDAGIIGYDENDSRAVAVRSQRGHSGFFLQRFDGLSARQLISFGRNTSRILGHIELTRTPSSDLLTMEKVHDGRSALRRVMEIDRQENRISLVDSVVSRPSEDDQRISRFLVDPSLSLRVGPDGLRLTGGGRWLAIRAIGEYDLVVVRGHEGAMSDGWEGSQSLTRGFVSSAPYSSEPTWAVEFHHRGRHAGSCIQFDISFG
ncbi:heparinase II/III domain-containing protein [Tessaracoccus lapidicaptus]|uniref:heparinase II/III domain-containing protein n=1 Tax=Tessaracoccus lapidicaptus TaxID=1427523 RepID=UPI003341D93D